MKRRLTIVQNHPTQFDMPLYDRMNHSDDWDLQVIYTNADAVGGIDRELGHSPKWDHITAGSDRGTYLSVEERSDVSALVDQITAHCPALVVLCGYYPRLHAELLGPLRKRGLKVGLRSDNTLPHSDFGGMKGVAKHLLLPSWLARYDCWHPVGSLARQYLEKMSRVKRPVYPFPYAVDAEWFETKAAEVGQQRDEYRGRLGLSAEDFVVLGIMKWHAREDPLTLLRAFSKLHEKHGSSKLLLIGDGPLRNEVRAFAQQFGDAVVLPGYQPYSKLPMFYAISDVFVHPSVNEPWGVSVQEALACSLPVLVAEGVGSRFDLLEDGVTGWTFRDGDEGALTQRLAELAMDSSLRGRMGAVARTHAHRLDYDFTLTQFSTAIDELSNRH